MIGLFLPLLQVHGFVPQNGMVVNQSMRFKPGTYLLPISHPDDKPKAAITIKGDNIVVDFQHAVLRGSPVDTPPDERQGTAIEVRGKNVTIKNVRVHGYKNGLIAFDSPGIKILDSDFSCNWKQRLRSTLEREDLSDWMSYHKNDEDQWLKGNPAESIPAYGGAIYLSNCNQFEVRGCKAIGGQNGLMMTRSNFGTVWNNNFSFLSSLGIGMYRSSSNKIMHNKIDWCVRGYSHGVYNRGQDSAGILVYEQSNNNVFAYNSVTHGGDGFFLWAGNSTMEDGKGGCNDNLLYGNDFSHAPTNGIEATFSRNTFANNLVLECWHGIWGGYSFESKVIGNVFGLNAQGIAWEHGQDNEIRANVFSRDREAIHLWMNDSQDPNWGYPKHRDTKSRDYKIAENLFSNVGSTVLKVKDTASITLDANTFVENGMVVNLAGTNPNLKWTVNTYYGTEENFAGVGFSGFKQWQFSPGAKPAPTPMLASGNLADPMSPGRAEYLQQFKLSWFPWPNKPIEGEVSPHSRAAKPLAPEPMKGGADPFLVDDTLRGRRYILVDEWGPYDFKSPIAWPRGEANGKQQLELLGPTGTWKLVEQRGVSGVSSKSGAMGDLITYEFAPGKAADVRLVFEFTGDEVITRFGEWIPAQRPVKFVFTRFFVPIDWNVKWFAWDDTTDPQTKAAAFAALIQGKPIKEAKVDKLDYAWWREIGPGLPADRFATIADGSFEIPSGSYELQVTTDDGVRVWVDGKLVIADAWKYQGPTPYSVKLKLGGKHSIRVEHFEINGFSTLQARIVPAMNK